MSIPFKARFIDLGNLLVAKGSNFLLTALLFALLAGGMDAHSYAEFGYWWSIAIMIGGVLLGGVSTAAARAVVLRGAVMSLKRSLCNAVIVFLLVGIAVGIYASVSASALGWLIFPVAMFGIAVQLQTGLLTLLRMIEATYANLFASIGMLILVPLVVYLALGHDRDLSIVFFALAGAFVVATVVALIGVWQEFRHIFTQPDASNPSPSNRAGAASFIAVNIFSYSVVNIDFTLFRLVGIPADFAIMADAKIFFERFALPVLLLVAGSVSMRVLRHKDDVDSDGVRLTIQLSPALLILSGLAIAMLLGAYWFYTHFIREVTLSIRWPWVLCAAVGYSIYAVNSVLFDVLVVRNPLGVVIRHVVLLMLTHAILQAFAISYFGVSGWSVGWLTFNLLVMLFLAREGVEVLITKRRNVRGSDTQEEFQ